MIPWVISKNSKKEFNCPGTSCDTIVDTHGRLEQHVHDATRTGSSYSNLVELITAADSTQLSEVEVADSAEISDHLLESSAPFIRPSKTAEGFMKNKTLCNSFLKFVNTKLNKSNSTADDVHVEANLQRKA